MAKKADYYNNWHDKPPEPKEPLIIQVNQYNVVIQQQVVFLGYQPPKETEKPPAGYFAQQRDFIDTPQPDFSGVPFPDDRDFRG